MDKKNLEAWMRERARIQGAETRQHQLADAAAKRAEADEVCRQLRKNKEPRK